MKHSIARSMALFIATFWWTCAAFATPQDGLLPVGKAAPDFTLKTLGGGKVNLKRTLAKNKVTLVNFWGVY